MRTCKLPGCNREFVPNSPRRKFCCEEHAARYRRFHYEPPKKTDLDNCEEPIKRYRPTNKEIEEAFTSHAKSIIESLYSKGEK